MNAESNLIKTEDLEQMHSDKSSAYSSPLKIGYDGKRAVNNLTGLGNYSRSLITELAKQFPDNEYLVYAPKKKVSPQIDSFLHQDNIHLKLPREKGWFWRSFGIIKDLLRDNVVLYHGLSHEIPFGIHQTKIKTVLTVHDLIFLRFPAYFKWIDRAIYNFKCKYACKNVDQIIAISERTRQDIIELYGINPNKIEVVYQSCDDSFKKNCDDEKLMQVKRSYALPDDYILSVGTIEERKNLLLLIQALPHTNEHYKLVVIGKKTAYYQLVEKAIQRNNLQKRVIFLENVPFTDLPALYQMAKLFVYPSFYEGFGIPIIEALYSNTPVIAASGSCLEEAGGPDSIYISPHNHQELANQINRVMQNTDLQHTMKTQGKTFVQKFNHNLANQLMDCYLKTLNHA